MTRVHMSDTERWFVGFGLVGLVLVCIGLLVGHMVPVPSPSENANQIAGFYQKHTTGIRIGTILIGFGASMLGPWYGVLTRRIKSIPGHGPAAAYCQLALGALLIFEIVLPITLIQIVAYRPFRSADVTLALNDLAMIVFISPAYTFIVELVVTAAAILRDQSTRPAFPAWSGWVNVLTAVVSLPGVTVIFVTSGPWRWSGLFGFWLPAAAFGMWILAMSVALLTPGPPSGTAFDRQGLSIDRPTG